MQVKLPDSPSAVAKKLEHTLLKIDESTQKTDLVTAVGETLKYGFRALVVHPNLVATITRHYPLVRVATVISYPLGCDSLDVKLAAVKRAADDGAAEIDAVLDLFAIRAGNWRKIALEARSIVEAAHAKKIIAKLILETPILLDEEIRALAKAIKPAGADFWKTSTGYGRRPTTLRAVSLLRELAPDEVHIKASGGFKALDDVMRAISVGAFVVGTSSGPAIIEEAGMPGTIDSALGTGDTANSDTEAPADSCESL